MGRTARRIGWILVALVATVALLVALRIPLASTLLTRWLAGNGVAAPTFEITRLGLGGLTLADVSAGTDGAVQAASLAVGWTPSALLQGRVGTVVLDGLRVRAHIVDASLRIPGIALPASRGSNSALPVLPLQRFQLTDARIDLATPEGPLTDSAAAHYEDTGDGAVGHGTIEARGAPGALQFTVDIHGTGAGGLEGVAALSGGFIDTPILRAPMLSGRGSFALSAGRLDTASLALQVPEVELPSVPGGLRGRFEAEGSHAAGTSGMHLTFQEATGGRGLHGTVTLADIAFGNDGASAHATIRGALQRLDVAGVALRDIAADLSLALQRTGDTIEVTTAGAGRIDIATLIADGAKARDPVAVTLPPTDRPLATLTLDPAGVPVTIVHGFTAAIAPIRLEFGERQSARTLELSETRLTYSGRYAGPDSYSGKGNVANSDARIDVPALALQRIEADVTIDDRSGNGTLRVDIGRLSDTAATERFAAVGVGIVVTRESGMARFVATVRDATQTIRATASGPWPLDGPRDEIFVDIPPIAFERGGKQPATLLPILGAFEVAQGRVFGNARITRRDSDYVASADATVDDMSLAIAGADIAGLAATVHFDSVVPPTTPPHQKIAIARIDMVTPIEDVHIDYRLADAGGVPRLDIAEATARLLGGSVALLDTRMPLDGSPVEVPVTVRNLDVAQLLELLGVDGLAGTGSLSGRVPLVLSPDTAEIRAGRLAADGPGVLKVDTTTAADFLAAQGPSVDLAIRALADFHYTELAIDIARRSDGDAALTLTLLGANPAVLDGHPFRFNINLKSNVDELIAALLQGYRIATERVGRNGAGR